MTKGLLTSAGVEVVEVVTCFFGAAGVVVSVVFCVFSTGSVSICHTCARSPEQSSEAMVNKTRDFVIV